MGFSQPATYHTSHVPWSRLAILETPSEHVKLRSSNLQGVPYIYSKKLWFTVYQSIESLVSPLESYSMPLNPHIEPPLNTKIMRNKNRKTPRCGSAWSANQRRPNRWRSDTSVLLVLSFGFWGVEILDGQSPHGSTNLRGDPLWCHVAASKISHHHCHVCCKRVWVVYCRCLKINPIVGVFSINHSLPKTAYRRLLWGGQV